jgi:hypothetical protein
LNIQLIPSSKHDPAFVRLGAKQKFLGHKQNLIPFNAPDFIPVAGHEVRVAFPHPLDQCQSIHRSFQGAAPRQPHAVVMTPVDGCFDIHKPGLPVFR